VLMPSLSVKIDVCWRMSPHLSYSQMFRESKNFPLLKEEHHRGKGKGEVIYTVLCPGVTEEYPYSVLYNSYLVPLPLPKMPRPPSYPLSAFNT
jgi:hypothetical protein